MRLATAFDFRSEFRNSVHLSQINEISCDNALLETITQRFGSEVELQDNSSYFVLFRVELDY